jgi:hypothetical protein
MVRKTDPEGKFPLERSHERGPDWSFLKTNTSAPPLTIRVIPDTHGEIIRHAEGKCENRLCFGANQ